MSTAIIETPLFDTLRTWAERQGWTTAAPQPQEYGKTPDFVIHTAQGGELRFHLYHNEKRNTSIVEMKAWPTLMRVRLVQKPGSGDWEMTTDSGIPFHHEWNETNFIRLAKDVLAAQ